MSDWGRYRKVFLRLWRNPVFRAMSDEHKTMTLYLLAGPQTNRAGFYVLSFALASEDLNTSPIVAKRRAAAVISAFFWEFDPATNVVWIPSWWRFNGVSGKANNLKGCLSDLNEVPRTHLITRFCNNLADIPSPLHQLVEGWRDNLTPFGQCTGQCLDTVATQEQDQEQDQEQEQDCAGARATPADLATTWNETASALKPVRGTTPDRERHGAARLAEQPDLTYWRGVFARINASPLCRGERPTAQHPHWRASFDWALKPGVHVKVSEGKYDDDPPSSTPQELAEAETIRRQVWGGRCRHDPPCESKAGCLAEIVRERREGAEVPP